MLEYAFELRLCATLEANVDAIVSRQIGAGVTESGNRVMDIVLVHPNDQFPERAAITDRRIPIAAIESDIGPGRARRWPPHSDWHPETASRILDDAVAAGFFEHERRRGRSYVRQTTRYPHWFDEIVGIENKPDLGDPGALAAQLRHDVRLRLFDRVILATSSHVTGAHLNRLPEAVGVWHVDTRAEPEITEIKPASRLPTDTWGTEILDTGRRRADIRLASPTEKHQARIRMAERAYGKGWRTFEWPPCAKARIESVEGASLPRCSWYEALIDPRTCGSSCPGYEPADPPAVDPRSERANRTQWHPDPPGRSTVQASMADF